MSRISAIAFVGLLVVALASCVAASAESHRNCLQKIDANSNKGPLTYVMNTCSCSLKTQVITPGYNGTNTTVVSVPAWDGSTSTRNIVPLPVMYSSQYLFGGSQAYGSECMPSLRFCVTGFPNYGTSTATLVNQCDVDIAVQVLFLSGNLNVAFPAYVPAWNGASVAPGQRANNEVVLPRFSISLRMSGAHFAVIQRSKAQIKADDHAFSLF